jgi:hypothetical protein
VSAQLRGSTITPDLIMLPRMTAYNINDVDRILETKEPELQADTLRELPAFIRDLTPHVFLAANGDGIDRWLAFGNPPAIEWLHLAPIGAIALVDRYGDDVQS